MMIVALHVVFVMCKLMPTDRYFVLNTDHTTEHEITVDLGPTYTDIDEARDVEELVSRYNDNDASKATCIRTLQAAKAAVQWAKEHASASAQSSSS
jgi:hypothetical protein